MTRWTTRAQGIVNMPRGGACCDRASDSVTATEPGSVSYLPVKDNGEDGPPMRPEPRHRTLSQATWPRLPIDGSVARKPPQGTPWKESVGSDHERGTAVPRSRRSVASRRWWSPRQGHSERMGTLSDADHALALDRPPLPPMK